MAKTTNISATSSVIAMATAVAALDPLDISVDAFSFTVADLAALIKRYPQDVPVRIGMLGAGKRAEPEFFPMTRLVFGEIEDPTSDDESQTEAAFVLMFDENIVGNEFEGPHDGDRDHATAILASATTEQKRTRRKPASVAQVSNVIPLAPKRAAK